MHLKDTKLLRHSVGVKLLGLSVILMTFLGANCGSAPIVPIYSIYCDQNLCNFSRQVGDDEFEVTPIRDAVENDDYVGLTVDSALLIFQELEACRDNQKE